MIKNLEHHKLRLTIHTQPWDEYNENEKKTLKVTYQRNLRFLS